MGKPKSGEPKKRGPSHQMDLRFLAFYLPQFHATPENDEWWGPGFTEWTNVRRANALFPGHYQPRVPSELGYYDLRSNETREAQAQLASQHRIDGFVYYHYWFEGRRLLGRPLDEVLATGRPDFPFCLCWANESWTRAWDGGEHDTLLAQTYSEQDDLEHIRWLARAFADERYIRIGQKPLFLVYRAGRLPDARRTTDLWREEASRMGIGELYLCRVENFPDERGDPKDLGFDASVEFQPDWLRPGPIWTHQKDDSPTLEAGAAPAGDVDAFEYSIAVALALTQAPLQYKRFRCVTPGFDNTPRRRRAPVIFVGSSPDLYAHFVRGVIEQFEPYSRDENLIFVNAWNEWGESNYLEPDQRWGRGYLLAHRAAAVWQGGRRATKRVQALDKRIEL